MLSDPILISLSLFASPVCGQDGQAVEPSPSSLASEVAAVQAENAELREQLRRLEEQQKTLLELVHGLQQRFDGSSCDAHFGGGSSETAGCYRGGANCPAVSSQRSGSKGPAHGSADRSL